MHHQSRQKIIPGHHPAEAPTARNAFCPKNACILALVAYTLFLKERNVVLNFAGTNTGIVVLLAL